MKIRLIIDASNLIFRANYANSNLATSQGKFSGHIFGSVASILAFLRNELNGREVELVCCYDGINSKAYRRTILPDYKGNREQREFNPIPEAYEVLRLWPGLHILQDDKEGDDAMAYAVKMLKGQECIVLSGDKDIWSLLQYPNCKVYSPNLRRFVEPSDIYEHFHIQNAPERIYLAKSLFGDASDNIEGVKRLLKKQVEPVLNTENIVTPQDFYNCLGSVRPTYISLKMWEKIRECKEKVFKNYLVIIPQLEFQKSSIVKVGLESLELLKQKLIEYECFSLVGQFG